MATISPFRAIHYNVRAIEDLSRVITPPYDVITPEEYKTYLARNHYNVAHILHPQKDYVQAAALLRKWLQLDILKTTATASYYLYEQNFVLQGVSHTRNLLMCGVLLSEFGEGTVRPHENTYEAFKEDRLNILRETRCNLSHIFGMVKDPEGFLASVFEKPLFKPPYLKGRTDDGVEHVVWQIEQATGKQLEQFFENRPVYIVDGHHRYESALAYAREVNALGKKENPASSMLFAVANSYDPALIVMPTHRWLVNLVLSASQRSHLDKLFQLLPLPEEKLSAFLAKPPSVPQFALYLNGALFLCSPKHWQHEEASLGKCLYKLPVVWSDHKFLTEVCDIKAAERSKRVTYEKDFQALWQKKKDTDVVIFLPTPSVDDIIGVADEKKFMPQKSTYFYPKLAAGLIMRDVSHP